ncbi:MAG: hypothetical protein ACNA8W_25250, partial [Bradymonadaceae bacterium]
LGLLNYAALIPGLLLNGFAVLEMASRCWKWVRGVGNGFAVLDGVLTDLAVLDGDSTTLDGKKVSNKNGGTADNNKGHV